MMYKKIIPCLDVRDGKVVKGINFEGIREMGDPVEMAKHYSEAGADVLVLLDITATIEGRETMLELVEKIAQVIDIPFIVGGGISSLSHITRILDAGASKVSIGSAA